MELVAKHLATAVMSAVNYGEVLKKTIEAGGQLEAVGAYVRARAMPVIPFDAEQAMGAAKLYPLTKPHGLSFADRACLNLGMKLGAMVLTSEKRMGETPAAVEVRMIRGKH
jgi:PIN domain nuclease of toxin-antitoxin system